MVGAVGLLSVWMSVTCPAIAEPPGEIPASPPQRIWSSRAILRPRGGAPSLRQVVARTRSSVVSIYIGTGAPGGDPTSTADKGIGSGFIVNPQGLILTNFHVVAGARDIQVTVDDGRRRQSLPASVLGVDEDTDLALLKVDAGRRLPFLPLGDSDKVQVGDWVVAEGTPFGLSQSVSFGVVSYLRRSDVAPEGHSGFRDYLQTDAAINPGSSGGPVLNLRGRVVGIADAVNTAGQGIGFAVPVNMAKAVIPDLLHLGRTQKAWMGVQVRDLTRNKRRR